MRRLRALISVKRSAIARTRPERLRPRRAGANEAALANLGSETALAMFKAKPEKADDERAMRLRAIALLWDD